MRAGNSILSLIIILLLLSDNSSAQSYGIKKFHPLSGRLGISLEGGTTLTLSDFIDPGWSYYGRFTTEYLFPSTQDGVWGLKGLASFGYLQGSGEATYTRPDLIEFKTSVFTIGGGGEYVLKLSDAVMPYIFVGAAYLYFDPKDLEGEPLQRNAQKKYSKNEWTLIGEAGFKFMVSNDVSLNLGFNMNYVDMDNLDDVAIGTDNDIYFSAFGGVSVYFLGVDDSDGDGVSDIEDLCPRTPPDVIVDPFGCPVDTDSDGVPDYLDICPNTPANVPVDIDGCIVDSDGDGVPDYLDLCKDTPEGVLVDKRGCALDEDGDGVPDYRDKCPGTPPGIEVNKFGCSPESSKKEQPEITSLVLSSEINFEVGSAKLLYGARPQLNILVNAMSKNPESMWRIYGYTDNTGSYSLNMTLSHERAQSVAEYFVQNGINRSRLMIRGLGPQHPIADNNTEQGRALNRRVEIEYIGEGISNEFQIEGYSDFEEYEISRERSVGNMIFTDGNLYCFQVASFRYRHQAEKELNKLIEYGENAFIVEANLPELDGIWYRVRIGYFTSLREAQESKDKSAR